jgi:hypothetical protein
VDAPVVGEPAARVCSCSAKQQSLAADEQLAASLGSNDYKEPQCIALDGDNLKPREDHRKGGNGFGINEDGAGYTLTAVDRHGVAYCADGGEVASTITRQISEQSGQDNRANAVVQCYDMTHADDPGRKVADGVSPTLQSRMGTGGNQVPLAVSTNSNGGDVAPTISSCEYKMGQKQKDTSGGYVVTQLKGES